MRVSVIIPSYKRVHLLKWGLFSLAKQDMPPDYEIVLLNDGILDETESLCNYYKDKLNIKYIFTGERNLGGQMVWRVPGFALNIGVKQSTGDVIVFCCAEMFHLNNTIFELAKVFEQSNSDKALAIPQAKDDNGLFLKHIESTGGDFDIDVYNNQPPLENVKFPFLLAMRKDEFVSIGGYDEDFTGTDYDDSDLVGRLLVNGCSHVETEAKAVHLWHPRLVMSADRIPRFQYNKRLYEERQGIVIRNMDKEWGVL